MRAAGIALSMGMDVKIADLVGGKDPADLVRNNPADWKDALRNAKPIIEFELGNVIRDTTDHRTIARALRERVFPFLARIESSMDKDHFVQMIADKANIGKDAVWQDLRTAEEKIKQERVSNSGKTTPASPAGGESSLDLSEAKRRENLLAPRGAGVVSSRIDLVERRMFGLLGLMQKMNIPHATEYETEITRIAGDTYTERRNVIESMMSDCMFEAEALFGDDPKRFDIHMKELIHNFETDLVSHELIQAMQELKSAEQAGDTDRVVELAKKCQVLSIRKAEIGKKKF